MRSVLAQEQQQEIQRALDREFAKARHNEREGREVPGAPKPAHVDDVVQIEIRQLEGHGREESVGLFDSRDWSQKDGWPRLLLDIVGAIEHDASSLYGDLMYGVFFHRENNKRDAARVRVSIQGGASVDRSSSALALRGGASMATLDPSEVMRAVPQLVSGIVDYVARERAQNDSTIIARERILVEREARFISILEKHLEQRDKVITGHTDKQLQVLELIENLIDRKEDRDQSRKDREDLNGKWKGLLEMALPVFVGYLSQRDPALGEALGGLMKSQSAPGADTPLPSYPVRASNGRNGAKVAHQVNIPAPPVAPPFSHGPSPFAPISSVKTEQVEQGAFRPAIAIASDSTVVDIEPSSPERDAVNQLVLRSVHASREFAVCLAKTDKLGIVRGKLDPSMHPVWDGWLDSLGRLETSTDDSLIEAASSSVYKLMTYVNENQGIAMSIAVEIDPASSAAFIKLTGALNELGHAIQSLRVLESGMGP